MHVLDKLLLRKMSTLFFRGSFKVSCRKFCYHKVEMEFDCSEELLKFLTQSKVFFIEYIYIYIYKTKRVRKIAKIDC